MLPVNEVQIESLWMRHRLRKSTYNNWQLDEFVVFQGSPGIRRAYFAETAKLAYNGRNEQGLQAQASMINIIGMRFIPTYKVIGPFLFFMSLLLMVWGGSSSQDIEVEGFGYLPHSGEHCSSWRSPPSTGSIRSWRMWGRRLGGCGA
jgi:hypothetical protein